MGGNSNGGRAYMVMLEVFVTISVVVCTISATCRSGNAAHYPMKS